jgi:hypothetical protein
MAGLHARMDNPMAKCVLPVPGGPRNTTLSLASTKSSAPRLSPLHWEHVHVVGRYSFNELQLGDRLRPSGRSTAKARLVG